MHLKKITKKLMDGCKRPCRMRNLAVMAISLLFSMQAAFSQGLTVSGTIADDNGEPLPGANIIVKGTTTGIASDGDGKYSISVSNKDVVLEFSYIGFATQEIKVGNQSIINVTLLEGGNRIDEVIVVAFGTQKKEAFTGSVGVVGSDNLKLSQQTNALNAIAGQVAGIQLTKSSGQLAGSPSILVRGFGSISSDNEPLYVVDGMPYDGNINTINPSDIESITVLKDAASNALYGARGANGVVMITTKRSKNGEAKITFDTRIGVNSVATKTQNFIRDPALWYETYYKSLYNQRITLGDDAATAHTYANNMVSGKTNSNYMVYTVPDGQDFISSSNGRINSGATLGRKLSFEGQDYWLQPDDWKKEGTREGLRQEYNLNVTGGDNKLNYFASVGYLNNTGITVGSDLERLTARVKGEYQAKTWLRVGTNMSYAKMDRNNVSGGLNSSGNVWSMVAGIGPVYPVYIRDGNKNIMKDKYGEIMYDFGDVGGLGRPAFTGSNPLFFNKYNTNNAETNAYTTSGFVDISIIEGLKLTINGGINTSETRQTSVDDPYAEQYSSTQNGGYVYKWQGRSISSNTQQLLNYTKGFNKHNINAMIGHEYYKSTDSDLSGTKTKMFLSENKELSGAIIDSGEASSYLEDYNNEGYFSRLQYDYDNEVFLSGSYRRDASSRFHPDYRWGNFWSLGSAWIVSKESWFNVPNMDMFKIKASIGSQGNDNPAVSVVEGNKYYKGYLYSDQYNIENTAGEVALVLRQKGNKKLTWETNTNFNTGVEFELFHGRLNGSLDYFYRKTSDMLFEFFVAPSNGYSSYFDNIGDMRNSGVELDLHGDIIRTKDLVWRANFNITHVSNKILSLPDDKKTMSIDGHDGYTWTESRFANPSVFFIGEDIPLYTFYTRKFAGLDSEGKSLWYRDIKDANGNITGQETTDVYSNGDYYLCGSALASLYGGFGTSLQYKGFDVAVNFNYQVGGKVYDQGYVSSMSSPSGTFGGNIHKDLLNAWSPENTSSNIPRLNANDASQTGQSDRFLTSADYLNLQNINIGYTLPSKLTKQFGISLLRIYTSMENVWYKSKRQGLDPRYSFMGSTDSQTYPDIRTISGGLTLQF